MDTQREASRAREEDSMFVTTSYHPTPAQFEQARKLSRTLQCSYIPRKQSSIPRMKREHGEQDVLVATTAGLRFFPSGSEEPFFFHPSSSQLRMKRLLRGESDALLESTGVQEGDRVLDCTAGLGSEAILLSYRAGASGSVTALESEPIISLLIEEGMRSYESGIPDLDQAMRRIQVVHADHTGYLRGLPDNSMDIVYFVPMFRTPIEETDAISPLRKLANDSALDPNTLKEAIRVAKRRVVLKEHRDSGEFARLGFRAIIRPHTKIAYGVMEK